MPGIDGLFPNHPRIIYEKNPLFEVVCQVRFPTILRIEAHPPAEFQDRLRDRLPLLERSTNKAVQQIPHELLEAIGAPQSGSGYGFKSEDGTATATLLADSLTVSTSDYERWEVFWSLCQEAFGALNELYAPKFLKRIGLRYRNLIDRDEIGLSGVPWSELLSEPVVSELSSNEWEGMVEEAQHQVRCYDAESGDGLLFQHGIGKSEEQNEAQYIIDFDFYRAGRIEPDAAGELFASYNRRIGRAFRWSIRDRLHDALGPT